MKKKCELKHRGRSGSADDDETELRILNRMLTWIASGIQNEGDRRHVETSMTELGLNDGPEKSEYP